MNKISNISHKKIKQKSWNILILALGLALFLLSLNLMGQSFRSLGQDTIQSIIQASSNPFIGLFIGLLITALIQSSSTSTAIIITAVASGSIQFHDVVPMILGANIGTTITSTLISIGYIDKKKEFKKAFATGVVHDFFNILVVLLLFPLELNYGILSRLTESISTIFPISVSSTDSSNSSYKFLYFEISKYILDLIGSAIITLLISFAGLIGAVKVVSKQIYSSIIGDSQTKLRLYLFQNPYKSFGWGALTTSIIQSSSITTSLVVPLVATGKVKLKKIAPFIYGANIGTTITAFITVAFNSSTVLNIAILHLLINIIGVVIFMPFPVIRAIPITLATKFAGIVAKRRVLVILYILLVFFIIPFLLINIYQGF